MARGHDLHQKRLARIQVLGKELARGANFRCEWCASKEGLRVFDTSPDHDPELDTLLFLCEACRELAGGVDIADPRALRGHCDALWSERDVVKQELAKLLARCHEPWAREAIEGAWIDEQLKAQLLADD